MTEDTPVSDQNVGAGSEPEVAKRAIAFHPALFFLFPVLQLFGANSYSLAIPELYRPALIATAAGGLLGVILSLVFRNWHRGSVIASVLGLYIFSSSPVWLALRKSLYVLAVVEPYENYFLLFLTLVLLFFLVRKAGPKLTSGFNFFGVMLVLLAGFSIVKNANSSRPIQPVTSTAFGANLSPIPKSAPDLYIIILDGHAREDALKNYIGYDASWFTTELGKRGFYVSKSSRSNYCQTELSLASFLNGQPIQDLFKKEIAANPESSDRLPLDRAINQNSFASALRPAGFSYMGITSGFWGVTLDSADVKFLINVGSLSGFEFTLLQNVPFLNLHFSKKAASDRRFLLSSSFDSLKKAGSDPLKNRFVLCHIVAPHPSFVFDENGKPLPEIEGCLLEDGTDYLKTCKGTSRETYAAGYAGQVKYTEKKILEAIDSILANRRESIIWILGDHGSKR